MAHATALDSSLVRHYREHGFALVPGLFPVAEVDRLRDHFDAMRRSRLAAGALPAGDGIGDARDPLAEYPRLMHPHRHDSVSRAWLLDARLRGWLNALAGRDPYAVQTMYYFKPPGARGQALHQDQYYLRVQPGTCIAAWMAVDRCDRENGCLQLVPGTHDVPVLCTEQADREVSFTAVTVPLPAGLTPVEVVMEPGDVLFFNGQVIHGSLPNRSRSRFRRALIAHYVAGEARQVARHYFPVLDMDGREVALQESPDGGPCGVWVERNGRPAVEPASPARQAVRAAARRGALRWNGGKPTGIPGVRIRGGPISDTIIEDRG